MSTVPDVPQGLALFTEVIPERRHSKPKGKSQVHPKSDDNAESATTIDLAKDLAKSPSCCGDGPPPTPEKKPVNVSVPITLVIFFAMFVSTGASMAGGLVMYFESLKSLEATVEETSLSELDGIAGNVKTALRLITSTAEQQKKLFYNLEFLNSDDPSVWANLSRFVSFAQITGTDQGQYSAGFVLIPYDLDTGNPFYSCIWNDPFADGSVEFVHAFSKNHINKTKYIDLSADGTESTRWTIDTELLDGEHGNITSFAYSWSAASYLQDTLIGSYDPRNGGIVDTPTKEWEKLDGKGTEATSRWRQPSAWWAADGNAYTFSSFDAIYLPPPPPHPWSSYRAVLMLSQYKYSYWEKGIMEYAKGHLDTTVVIADAKSYIVYASTTGQKMLGGGCLLYSFDLASPLECATKIGNMSLTVQEAFLEMLPTPDGTFRKATLDGESYFLRKGGIHHDVVVLWIRPTSSVEGKVQSALNLLIVFTGVVLAFDVVISAAEVFLVALPLQRVSNSVTAIGRMECVEAITHIERYQSRCFMVREMRILMNGMVNTIARINEYKAYMPDAILENSTVETVEAPAGDIALVFTDIVKSTDLWESEPEAMAASLDIHNKTIRRHLSTHRGYEVKTIGDAFMVAFQDPENAVAFATEVQAALVFEQWPEDILAYPQSEVMNVKGEMVMSGLRVRMGVHYGPVETELNPLTERSDYRGGTVNKAARIEAQAVQGMVCLSEEIVEAMGKTKSDSFTVHPFEKRALKGIGEVSLHYAIAARIQLRGTLYKSLAAQTLKMARVGKHRQSMLSASHASGESQSNMGSHIGDRGKAMEGFSRKLKMSEGALVYATMTRIPEAALGNDDPAAVMSVLNQTFQILVDYTAMTEAKIECFTGSTVTISWNCATKCSVYSVMCLKYAGLVGRRGAGVNLGVVCGTMFHGFVGSSAKKFHTVVGACVQYAAALSRDCAKHHNCCALFMQNRGFSEAYSHCGTPVDVWEGVRRFEKYMIVEKLFVDICAELQHGWEDDDDVNEDCPARIKTIRTALKQCAQMGGTLSTLEDTLGDEDICLEFLMQKKALVTPITEVL